jgi:hypothetical protein
MTSRYGDVYFRRSGCEFVLLVSGKDDVNGLGLGKGEGPPCTSLAGKFTWHMLIIRHRIYELEYLARRDKHREPQLVPSRSF